MKQWKKNTSADQRRMNECEGVKLRCEEKEKYGWKMQN